MTFHWPRFQAARWPDGVDHVDVDARTHAGKPNIIRVRQTLRDLREHEAVAYCLAHAPSFRVKLERGAPFHLTGQRLQAGSDGIVALTMTRAGD